jgi:hypothetical protein
MTQPQGIHTVVRRSPAQHTASDCIIESTFLILSGGQFSCPEDNFVAKLLEITMGKSTEIDKELRSPLIRPWGLVRGFAAPLLA